MTRSDDTYFYSDDKYLIDIWGMSISNDRKKKDYAGLEIHD